MNIIRTTDYKDMSRKAAGVIAAQVIMKPDCVLGLATGSSPLGLYSQLIEWYKKGDLDFSQTKSINLDEYKGLPRTNDQSYFYFMNENFFKHVNINLNNTNVPDGTVDDADQACEDYNKIIRDSGGIDLQLLGIGHNGHIGFNEPDEVFAKGTHCVNLAESTIAANARFFSKPEEVPTQAYTMGIQTIMQARKILLIVSGKEKAEILFKSLFGPITPQVPASILQMHPNVTVVADQEALTSCPNSI
jgi:glucosamine-6-phosphate deaminase